MTSVAERTRLLLAGWALLCLLLSLVPTGSAGTADAPEITDAADDQELLVLPIGQVGQFTSADILAGWIEEDADNLLFNIQIQGSGATSTTTEYSWTVHMTVGAEDKHASAASTADQPTPGDAATAAALADGVITLTVPRAALGATVGMTLTGIAIESNGNVLGTGVLAVTDTAPDGGEAAGASYLVTGGGAPVGNATNDSDGDGLNDTWETQQFGNLTLQNGTGDPDKDGLNNSAEFAAGTNATNPDTDGDNVLDGQDAAPLDPNVPPLTNTTDRDNDTLPDQWERTNFNSTAAQNATGDPDKDGLNNSAELAAGTDPNKADSDGDGVNDALDAAPLDATKTKAETVADTFAKPELYSGAAMFAAAATFCLLGLARGL